MRILLDECLPVRLARLLVGHEAKTVRQLNLLGRSNGKLLAAADPLVDVFLTVDKNLVHQQDLSDDRLSVIVLRARSNKMEDLAPLLDQIMLALNTIGRGQVVTVG